MYNIINNKRINDYLQLFSKHYSDFIMASINLDVELLVKIKQEFTSKQVMINTVLGENWSLLIEILVLMLSILSKFK